MATTEIVTPAFLAEDRSQVLVDISIAFIVLTTVVLAARFYARRFQGLGGFHADDAFVLAAYVVNLGMCAVGISESRSLLRKSFFLLVPCTCIGRGIVAKVILFTQF